MPIPTPRSSEHKKSDFISRCMSDPVMVKEFEQDKRAGICYSQWDKKKKKKSNGSISLTAGTEEFIFNESDVENDPESSSNTTI